MAPARVEPPVPAQRVTPLAPQRYAYECTFDQETLDLLQRARDLLGHLSPPPDGPSVLKSALRLLVGQLEKQKYAATDHPRHSQPGLSARHIPAEVKRAVRERDGERCAFVSESGHRCSARDRLEFDHIEPVARGGESTVDNVRLLCRAHNQHAAERMFGVEFMERRRAGAR
jgi:HNH endonuclease